MHKTATTRDAWELFHNGPAILLRSLLFIGEKAQHSNTANDVIVFE